MTYLNIVDRIELRMRRSLSLYFYRKSVMIVVIHNQKGQEHDVCCDRAMHQM